MMEIVIFLVLCLIDGRPSVHIPHSPNGIRQCRASTGLSITAMEVLPGGGWDNLRNIDMGRVMNMSFTYCQTTEDGLFFIPDEVFVIPRKETGVETYSEIITSWMQQTSVTSHSINTKVSFFSVLNGKYSEENQQMKTHQVKDSAVTSRVQVRNVIYTVKAYPDFTLDSRFAQQVKEVADAIENNQTRNAAYLSEKMVMDYGTHVITSVDAGAVLVQEDYLRSAYVTDNQSDISSVKAQTSLNFFNALELNISSKDTQKSSMLQDYQSNIQYSIVQSYGGASFYPGITLQKWQESTRNNLVAIDRSGLPLYFFINTNNFPDLPQPTVGKVALVVSKAVERYYKVNKRPGCVDINSKNFNFQANIDDSSCEGPATNHSFGGVYQECVPRSSDAGPLCKELEQKNPDTGDFSCRSPYKATLLRSELRQQSYNLYQCHDQQSSCGFLYLDTCHSQVCQDNYYVHSATINTYWCSVNGKAPDNSGYLFGGIYSPSLLNPITNSKSCPASFIPVKFLSDGQVICVSKDYEAGTRSSVPFAGLFSCESGNPLANGQRRCPPKFSQQLATVSDGCEILYCVQSGLFTGGQLRPVRLPPFIKPSLVSMQRTNTVMVMTEGDKIWVRVGQTKMWKLVKPGELKGMATDVDPESKSMSSGAISRVAFGVLGLVVAVAVVIGVVFLVNERRGLSGSPTARGYQEMQGGTEDSDV
ncbi:macrophage-expressed gene 1 protein-like [Sphaeramia orbicularis]|uniref:Macrophage-expressed gene 1 protein n=1 Tax=Sphaeramia orbicularis TaxID=375764 RepID=A0A673C2F8_9TELE|nr:macrophage-expressed gene 1 protein-like [Sphaeramia orbicularis]XP_030000458.1 macrophage-expressed gene 1 protein-like [Sphaeramia orbicularis]